MRGTSSSFLRLLSAVLVVGVGVGGGATRTAEARPGIVGFSGRPFNGSSDTCTACHTGSTDPPRLDITAPDTIAAGATGQVTIVVAGSRVRTSMNASFPDGVRAIAGADTSVPIPLDAPNEIAAVTPPPSGATGTYTFAFIAPATNGPLTLWVAAISANGGGTTGDGVAATTRTIEVIGGSDAAPAPPPPAGSSSAPTPVHAIDPFGSSAPSPSPSEGGAKAKAPASPAPGGTASSGSNPDDAPGPGGCAASAETPRHAPATLVAALAGLVALALGARPFRRRRARRRSFPSRGSVDG